jgi:hypothetical protein
MFRSAMVAAGACAMLLAPGKANAATMSSTVQLTIVAPFTVVKIADLEFGALMPSAAAGTVVINPTTGARTTTGGVTGASGSYFPAHFATAGSPNQHITIRLPNSNRTLTRVGGGATMTARTFRRDNTPPVSARLDANGNFEFRVGATLNVGANQMPGRYVGSFDVEVNYQ